MELAGGHLHPFAADHADDDRVAIRAEVLPVLVRLANDEILRADEEEERAIVQRPRCGPLFRLVVLAEREALGINLDPAFTRLAALLEL